MLPQIASKAWSWRIVEKGVDILSLQFIEQGLGCGDDGLDIGVQLFIGVEGCDSFEGFEAIGRGYEKFLEKVGSLIRA
jgi:hypothetical protein